MRRKMVFKESVVRKDDDADVTTPSVDEIPSSDEKTEGRVSQIKVTAESKENMKKRALVALELPGFSTFSILCDEGRSIGGDDTAPAPMAYFAAAVAF